MRTSLLLVVPGILLGGLFFGVFRLNSLSVDTPCTLGLCTISLHESDSGKTFLYNVGARFNVFLDEDNNPKNDLHCVPEGVISLQEYTKSEPPSYRASFEALTRGTCVLSDQDFSVTIFIQ